MIKPIYLKTLVVLFTFALAFVFMYYIQSYSLKYRPNVSSIHVINLDKDTDRMEHIKQTTIAVPLPVERWAATLGKSLSQDELYSQGVGFGMTNSGKGSYLEQGKDLRNQGMVGCFLSHRSLIQHLSTRDVPEYSGHLILEDDVQIPVNFLQKDDIWSQVYKTVPFDWDIVYLGITKPVGELVNSNVMKLKTIPSGNWGTHAYLVRHGSIKSKILPWLKYMIDHIDQQYKMKFDTWNCYAIVPSVISLNQEISEHSSIQNM